MMLWCSSKLAQLYKISLCNKIYIQPFLVDYRQYCTLGSLHLSIFHAEGLNIYNWRASEASETLSGVYKFEPVQYMYIYINTIADFLSYRKCIAQK